MRGLLTFSFLGAALATEATWAPIATVAGGVVVGTQTVLPDAPDSPVNKFLSIPFAAKPERFRPPTAPEGWDQPREVKKFAAVCPQNFGLSPLGPDPEMLERVFYEDVEEDEDCLKLSVFTPATSSSEPRAVLLFIPGGGFQLGHGNIDLGHFAAYEDLVTVTINYRTNVFGFPPSPELELQNRNLGLLDQRFALEWVQENIAEFGGDPDRVTIWGQSAGSMSVDLHLRAYGAAQDSNNVQEPPFQAAIMSSGQMSFGMLTFTRPPTDSSIWDALVAIVGCGNTTAGALACMQQVPVEALQEAMVQYSLAFQPVIDGVTFLPGGASAWREGRVANVPILTGTVAEEGRSLVNDKVNMTDFITSYFPQGLWTQEGIDGVFNYYRALPGLESDFDVAAAIYTDYFWTCPQAILANVSATNGIPTHRYLFNASVPALLPASDAWLGACHGLETILLFANETVSNEPLPSQAFALKQYLLGALGDFVREPGHGPGWPEIGSGARDIAVLGDTPFATGGGGATMLGVDVVDARCPLFEQAILILEAITG